jgi:CRP/FNR family transcriptional regulator, nitrogen oxide reductase regulator
VIVIDPKNRSAKVDLKAEILKHSTLFCCLGNEEIEELSRVARFRRFTKDEFIFHQGDPPNFLYVIGSGKVKQFKQSVSGKVFTTAIMSSGDPLNAVALYGAKSYFVSAQAMNETTALSISRPDFLSFVGKYPIVTERLVSLLGRVLNSAWERLTDFVGEMVCQRIFNILYMLYYKFGDAVPVTKEELADMAGTTTETAIRVLGKLKRLGIVASGRGQVRILSRARLRNVSNRSYLIHQQEESSEDSPRVGAETGAG